MCSASQRPEPTDEAAHDARFWCETAIGPGGCAQPRPDPGREPGSHRFTAGTSGMPGPQYDLVQRRITAYCVQCSRPWAGWHKVPPGGPGGFGARGGSRRHGRPCRGLAEALHRGPRCVCRSLYSRRGQHMHDSSRSRNKAPHPPAIRHCRAFFHRWRGSLVVEHPPGLWMTGRCVLDLAV